MIQCQIECGLIPIPEYAMCHNLKDDLGSIAKATIQTLPKPQWITDSILLESFLIRYGRVMVIPGQEVSIHISYGDLYTTHRYVKDLHHYFKRRVDYKYILAEPKPSLISDIFHHHLEDIRQCPFIIDETLLFKDPVRAFKEIVQLDLGFHYLRYLCEQESTTHWLLFTLRKDVNFEENS